MAEALSLAASSILGILAASTGGGLGLARRGGWRGNLRSLGTSNGKVPPGRYLVSCREDTLMNRSG
jgi:hypothetical protein